MIAVLEDVRKVVQFWDKLTKSKQSNSKSYSNLKNGFDDPSIHAKLGFFSYVACIIEPFLKKFQTAVGSFSFLWVKAVVPELLEIVVKSPVINSYKNVLILDLNKNKIQNHVKSWAGRDSIRSYFNFIPKISITMQVLHVLL